MENFNSLLQEYLTKIEGFPTGELSLREVFLVFRVRDHIQAHLLGLTYFVYSGSKTINRKEAEYCNDKTGNVFSLSELKSWKPALRGYDVLLYGGDICIGDDYCGHGFDYITYETATVLRPDLKGTTSIQLTIADFERMFKVVDQILKK